MNKKMDYVTKSHLHFQGPEENRSNIVMFFLLLLYFFGLFPLIGYPVSKGYLLTAIIPVVIITLWGLPHVVNPYKYEVSYHLFFGVYGLVNTFVFFLVIQKLVYMDFQATSILVFPVSVLLYLVLFMGINISSILALHKENHHTRKQKNTKHYFWEVAGSSIYVIGQLIIAIVYANSFYLFVVTLGIAFLSIITVFFSTNIHKYFYIRKHIDQVKEIYPQFGLSKAERYKVEKRKTRKKRRKRKKWYNDRKSKMKIPVYICLFKYS